MGLYTFQLLEICAHPYELRYARRVVFSQFGRIASDIIIGMGVTQCAFGRFFEILENLQVYISHSDRVL